MVSRTPSRIKIDGTWFNIRGQWTADQLRQLYSEYTKRNRNANPMTFRQWAVFAGKVVNRWKNA